MDRSTALNYIQKLFRSESTGDYKSSAVKTYPILRASTVGESELAVQYSVLIRDRDIEPDMNLVTVDQLTGSWMQKARELSETADASLSVDFDIVENGVTISTDQQQEIESLYDIALTHPTIIRRELEAATHPDNRDYQLRYDYKPPSSVTAQSRGLAKKIHFRQAGQPSPSPSPIPQQYHELLEACDTSAFPLQKFLTGKADWKLDVRRNDGTYHESQSLPTPPSSGWYNPRSTQEVTLAFILRCQPSEYGVSSNWVQATNYIQFQYGHTRIHPSDDEPQRHLIESAFTDRLETTEVDTAVDHLTTQISDVQTGTYVNTAVEYAASKLLVNREIPYTLMGIEYPIESFVTDETEYGSIGSPLKTIDGVGEKTIRSIATQHKRYDNLAKASPTGVNASNAYSDNDPETAVKIATLGCRMAATLSEQDELPDTPAAAVTILTHATEQDSTEVSV